MGLFTSSKSKSTAANEVTATVGVTPIIKIDLGGVGAGPQRLIDAQTGVQTAPAGDAATVAASFPPWLGYALVAGAAVLAMLGRKS